jgi:sulfur dioxygenase
MIFRQLFEKVSSTYTYLLGDVQSREAVLIDPVRETAERDLLLIKQLGLTLKYSINTHVHADHVTSSALLKKASAERCQEISEDRGAPADANQPECQEARRLRAVQTVSGVAATGHAACDLGLEGGESLYFGNRRLIAIATPGHTAGCISFVLDDASMVFSGDAVLIRGCGRTDFQGGSASLLYERVNTQIFSLPDGCLLYPGHDYNGLPNSTIWEERHYNKRLACMGDHDYEAGLFGVVGGNPDLHGPVSMEKYIDIMDNLNLPKPKQIETAVPANLACGVY